MKILSPSEVKQANEAERVRDITRTESTKTALTKVQQQLDEVEAKFELALSNQRIRWSKEEEEATTKVLKLTEEVKKLEEQKRLALIPIENEKQLAHNLFIQAEAIISDAKSSAKEAEQQRLNHQKLSDTLQERLDELTDREVDVARRENELILREHSLQLERENIIKLSQELSIKLTKL